MAKSILLLALVTSALALPQAHAADKYYKWVDAQGSTHYTQTPPPASKARKVLKSVAVSRHVNGSSVPGYSPAPTPAAPSTNAPTPPNTVSAGVNGTMANTAVTGASLSPSASGNAVPAGSSSVNDQATGNNTALPTEPVTLRLPSDGRPE